MNIKFILNTPNILSKDQIKTLVSEVEVFCSCGLKLTTMSFEQRKTCPECGREYHLQEGNGHFHLIVNKPTEGTVAYMTRDLDKA